MIEICLSGESCVLLLFKVDVRNIMFFFLVIFLRINEIYRNICCVLCYFENLMDLVFWNYD